MSQIPHAPAFDSTLAILREGYPFIWKRCQRFGSDLFTTRVMGMRAVCIHGAEAAALFYDEEKLQRAHAIPRRVVTSLFGKHAVQTLDGDAHRQRKAAFLSLMTPQSLERLMDLAAEEWRHAIRRWEERAAPIVLFEEAQRVLAKATCAWAGVPLSEADVPRRARDFASMIDAFGGAGPRLWKGKLARARADAWMKGVIEHVRRGKLRADPGTALRVMAELRDVDGELVPAKLAAIELINVIRPTVAISWYVAFAALALHEHPEARERLAHEAVGTHAGAFTDRFVQEVRRFYPFAPYLGAKVKTPFEWRGHRFEEGTLVLLDIWGNNHDPRIWGDPNRFRPDRFRDWEGSPFDFIPQGGGALLGHRCPGEWMVMHHVALALHFLTRCMTYAVPSEQDLTVDLTRMPARPESGLLIRDVRATAALAGPAPRAPSATAAHDSAEAEAAGELAPIRVRPQDAVSGVHPSIPAVVD